MHEISQYMNSEFPGQERATGVHPQELITQTKVEELFSPFSESGATVEPRLCGRWSYRQFG